MKRAIIYARVSTARQADDGVSMDSQIEQCHVKAAALGVTVDRVFRDDGRSGRTDNRPGFQDALAYCASHSIRYFICWSTSRFGRNLEDALKNVNLLRNWGTSPAYVHQDIDLDTDGGWMLGVLTGMMDEMHSRNVARDTLRSMISASRDGWWVGGRAPFGYRPEKVGKRHRLVPDEIDAEVVRTMYRLALEDGQGAQTIAQRLNGLNLLRSGRPWGKTTVAGILKNPCYMGVRQFNRTERRTRTMKDDDQVVHVPSHPPIVSREDWDAVQQLMAARVPHAEHGGTPRSMFAFTGLLRCSICGGDMQISNGKGRGGRTYSYYRCMGHRAGKARCLMKPIPAQAFDQWMVGQLLEEVLTAEVVQRVVDEIRGNSARWLQDRALQRKHLVTMLRDAEGRRNRLYALLESDTGAAVDDLLPRLRQLNTAITEAESQLQMLETRKAPDYSAVDIDPHEAALAIRKAITDCQDPKALRSLLGTFVSSVTLTATAVTVEYREDALLRSPVPTVHSGIGWLLNLGSNQGPTD